ncbi:phosphatase PAP2 family protein [Novosphingobium sp. KN65.2]|uniref:phosphatase PAP2 family protein n=1 Tax=Novosphingobium sp. KN65.2 TaxID=1478134 RepID=UPI0006D56E2E|nr:phosphatase PAP2 family protein [Novosphingobium sp. KN65.2]
MNEDKNWLIPSAALLTLQYVVVFTIGYSIKFAYELAVVEYLILAGVTVTTMLVILLLFQLFQFARRNVDSPIRDLLSVIREKSWFLFCLSAGITFVALQLCSLSWSKSMIPYVTDMWADPMLASIDRSIFFVDPWRITHAIFGDAPFIDYAYIVWAPIKMSTLMLIFLLPSSPVRSRCILAYFITVSAGCAVQYLLPSGGPIFYERLGHGADFTDLPFPHFARIASDYLWASYRGTGAVGAGISAMPSMHVAATLWIALSTFALDRRIGILAFGYFIIIVVGSVHTGWHYGVDAIGGSLLALVAWRVAGRMRDLTWPRFRARNDPASAGKPA